MPKIVNGAGDTVAADDPSRLVWHAAVCGYWTDDWSNLGKVGPGIPCCPTCKKPGFMCTAGEWEDGVASYDRTDPGYAAFVNATKETCFILTPGHFIGAWNAQRAARDN